MQINLMIPDVISVPVPATGKSWDVNMVNADAAIINHLIFHALKQKLGDAAAGAKALAEKEPDAYPTQRDAAIAMVDKRMDTILDVPTQGEARETMTELEREILVLVRGIAKAKGAKGNDIPKSIKSAREYMEALAGEKFAEVWAKIETKAESVVAARGGLEIEI